MESITVGLGERSYPIYIGTNLEYGKLIKQALPKVKDLMVVTNDTVGPLYFEKVQKSLQEQGFNVHECVLKDGECYKTLDSWWQILTTLLEQQFGRDGAIVALGGGVVGDMAGFAAATYLRGIDFVQIPTTLLAQIDSSVGGKTAIDISGGKNLVGAFKQPLLVICDTNTLDTLSPEIFSDGMAEAIKYGMIKDKALFEQIASRNYNTISDIIDELVYKCIDIKRQVVENDEFENGERMILNFGHTIGHAVECYYNYEKYTHGCGVAVGMCYITSKCCCDEVFRRLEACVRAYNLPTSVPADISQLLPYCSKDKKRAGSNISYIVCPEIGKAEIRRASVKEFDELMEG